MTDYVLSDRDAYRTDYDETECQAYDEAGLQTCPCASCRSYRRSQEANAVYQQKYDEEMEAVREAVQRPFYRGWTVP